MYGLFKVIVLAAIQSIRCILNGTKSSPILVKIFRVNPRWAEIVFPVNPYLSQCAIYVPCLTFWKFHVLIEFFVWVFSMLIF